jgi:hypothetical protein
VLGICLFHEGGVAVASVIGHLRLSEHPHPKRSKNAENQESQGDPE